MSSMAGKEKIVTTTQTEHGEVQVHMDKEMHREHPNMRVVFDDPQEIVREAAGGFINFLREKAVVGLAVGFIIGQQAQTVIKQLVDSFVTPIINMFIGSSLQNHAIMVGGEKFAWGKFIYVLINFLLVILAIYTIIKLFKLDKLDLPKDQAKTGKKKR